MISILTSLAEMNLGNDINIMNGERKQAVVTR